MGDIDWMASPQERRAHAERQRRRAEQSAQAIEARRRKVGERVAMMIVDLVNDRVIRPGPMNEERECYDLAKEMHDLKPEITLLVAAIIEVDETGKWEAKADAR